MRIERERDYGAIRYRWVTAPCGDPYCRQKVHVYCLVDIENRERWFMAAVLDVDELPGADVVEDTISEDRDLFDRATVMAVLWGCRWEGVSPRQIQLQILASRELDPHALDLLEEMDAADAERLRGLCKGGVYPALLDMMGAYAANTGGETRRAIGGSDDGETGGDA